MFINRKIILSFFFLIYLLLACYSIGKAQDKDVYVKKIKQAKQEILNIQKAIQTSNKTIEDLQIQLQLSSKKIKLQQEIILTKEYQLRQINKKIDDLKSEKKVLERKKNKLLSVYAEFLRYAQKTTNLTNNMLFIFSSSSIYQAYKRMSYFNNFNQARKYKLAQIQDIDTDLDDKIIELRNQQFIAKKLLKELAVEKNQLVNDTKKLNAQIEELKKQTKFLKSKLEVKEKEKGDLDKKMKAVVSATKRNENDNFLSLHFKKNKGKLKWPVQSSVILLDYGNHKHEVFDEVVIKNDGIDILVTKNFDVSVVYDGKVKKVIEISENRYAVLVQHGEYYTVYINIQVVSVKEGDLIKTGEKIGKLYKEQNRGVLQFQVWYLNEKLNPKKWLIKK